ncbi:MAG: SAM-dependent methyltransferase [Fimbriimonadaceae bacterium]
MMATSASGGEQQLVQTRLRRDLVDHWAIPNGARVLEIGCGQGDTTVVLAEAVGEAGKVVAVDVADPSYGAPVSIGASARHITQGPLGDRVEFRFEFDPLDPANAFRPDAFDALVFAHCTWYFGSLGQLTETLRTVRPWAKRLCLSEWDIEPRSIDQFGHFLAVLIQGQVEALKAASLANVRTPYSRETLHGILQASGWSITSERPIDSSPLADASWETAACLERSLQEAANLDMPPKALALLATQLDVLAQLAARSGQLSLPSYSIVAERA